MNDRTADLGDRHPGHAVAVIGMALRVPGAATPEAFRRFALGRRCAFETLDRGALAGRVSDADLRNSDYVPAGAFLDVDIAQFDAQFFGLDERRARFMDPQQRLFLECCWESLEHGGKSEAGDRGRVGVFGGTSANAYLVQNLLGNPAVAGTLSADDLELCGNKDHAALVAAYCLGLTGPAVTVQSCCSTSLLAVHLAVQSLLAGECDIALAGAMSLRLPERTGYLWSEGSILSRQGRCRPFDSRADGTVFGSGGGVVALKAYAEALEDGDPIHAVILGSAVNNDGARKAGYVAPSLQGQRDVLAEALEVAGLRSADVGYVEAHGTGTAVGDAVELRALHVVHGAGPAGRIALGTVKANIGHLDVASGIAGLINAVHVVRNGTVAGLAGFERPAAESGLADGPFLVPSETMHLPEDGRVAGVSSFGVGGTNVHVLLAAAPRRDDDPRLTAEIVPPFRRKHLWVDAPYPTGRTEGDTRPDQRKLVLGLINEVAASPLTQADMARDFLDLGFDSLTLSQLTGRLRRETGLDVSLPDLADPEMSPAGLLLRLEQMPPGPAGKTAKIEPPDRPVAVRGDKAPPQAAAGPYLMPVAAQDRGRRELTAEQRDFLAEMVAAFQAQTATSKRLAVQSRPALANPRSISGFDQRWKGMCYPIVSEQSAGAGFTDVDGNRYLDMVMGFGTNYLGHSPDYVSAAIRVQLDKGYELGPQTPLAVEVAETLAGMTGVDRVAFCNTGSEAVAAACRVARTATGRDGIVAFNGSYHGGFDAVLGRPAGGRSDGRVVPIAPGIPNTALADLRLFEYGAQAALDHIAAHADEIAAVLVEPVQTRNPENQPIAFLHDLRALCTARGIVLIFDEVVTGFRCHPGGAQALFGISADLATYGKVIGGGLPIAALAGRAALLDHIDGGSWQFGDGSAPAVARTFLAGTFVRHPLAMAAARAALNHLAAGGNTLTFGTTARVNRFCVQLNQIFEKCGIKAEIRSFASFAAYKVDAVEENFEILFPLLRLNRVYVGDAKLAHFSVMHSDADMQKILQAHADALDALAGVGLVGLH